MFLALGLIATPATPVVAQNAYPSDVRQLTLPDCIAIALRNQPAIRAQQAAVGVAEEQHNIARSHFFPQVNFNMRYTLLDEVRSVDVPSPFTGPLGDLVTDAGAFFSIARQAGSAVANAALDNPNLPPFSTAKQAAQSLLPSTIRTNLLGENFLTTQLRLVQPLWTGGKIRYRNEQAKLGTHAAAVDVAKAEQETVFNVTHGYLAIQLAGELVQVAEDTAGEFQAIEWLIESALKRRRHVTAADLERSRSLRFLAESEQVRVRRAKDQAYVALRLAMGVDSNIGFQVSEDRLNHVERQLELPSLFEQAYTWRPELSKARIGVDVAALEAKLADAQFHPDVAFFGQFSTIHDDRGFANPNDPQEWAAGVAVEVPLFAGGRRFAQRRQAEHLHQKAHEVRQLLRNAITREVEQAYLQYLEMSERIPLAGAAVHAAKETMERYDDQYVLGLIKDEHWSDFFEDLLTTQLLLTQAQVRYYQTVFEGNLALAKVQLVTASDEYLSFLNRSPSGNSPDSLVSQHAMPGSTKPGRAATHQGAALLQSPRRNR